MDQLLLLLILAAVKGNQPTIKSVAVAGPVVGSQSTFGRVDLTAPATQPVVITLTTSDLQRGKPPASVTVAPGQSMQTFVIKPEPVAAPTTVTLTARTPGSPDATANFTVIPPALTILDCEPKSVSGGSHATCKAWMDGLVAAGATPQIALATSNGQVVTLPASNATVPSGNRSVTFDVAAADLPQSASATISATYGGVTKSSTITVTPAAIKSFGCVVTTGATDTAPEVGQCSVVGGDFRSDGLPEKVGLAVQLTALAPLGGYKIPLTFTFVNAAGQPVAMPHGMQTVNSVEVPRGNSHAFFSFHTEPMESAFITKVMAKDPITHNSYETELTINPPKVRWVRFYPPSGILSAIPLGGTDERVDVVLFSKAPEHGIAFDVIYSGTTDIKGPANVRMQAMSIEFHVTVFPCAINPPCHVSVTLGGVTATATVNP